VGKQLVGGGDPAHQQRAQLFTPYGDASLIRMANLYANVAHVSRPAELVECFAMLTTPSARLMRRDGYGIAPGNATDLSYSTAPIRVPPSPNWSGLKAGRLTFTHPRPTLRPQRGGDEPGRLSHKAPTSP
jgi:cytosine/creatinine deaminase